ncbi:MAG: hypothetical protein CVV06_01980 [Gammaproteobacteria bacterium HGW-Gammaproteobacteria-10]|nr:MAG: hypothetical protein CVV06_01980 [Gammaproteobacteria bacterium HGW-Gammaproteobacteria-10]
MNSHLFNICTNAHTKIELEAPTLSLLPHPLLALGIACSLTLALPVIADDKVAETATEQTRKKSTAKTTDKQNSVVVLKDMVITGEQYPLAILPTFKSVSSVFGTEQSVLDIPRSVSVISKSMLQLREFNDFTHLERVAAGVYTPGGFGTASLPVIRTQQGEIFQNGQRKEGGNGGFGFPHSFNGVEDMEIIKGPPSVVYGPGQRVGGYVNLNSKRAYLDKFRGEVSGTAGSFNIYRWGLDVGAPIIKDELGFRLSYQGEDSRSYYKLASTNSQAVYGALDWHPNDRFSLDFNAEYFDTDFSDIGGINRPTQALIDNGTYITGTGPIDTVTGLPQTGQGTVVTPTGTTKINRRNVFIGPNDLNEHTNFMTQLNVSYQVNDSTKLANHSSFQSLDKATVDTNSFVEIIDENYTFQNRSELHKNFDMKWADTGLFGDLNVGNEVITGLDYRFHHTRGFSNFNFEDDNSFDLTRPASTRVFAEANLSGVLPVPGYANPIPQFSHAFASPGGNYPGFSANGDTNETDYHQVGLFYQHTFHFGKQWTLLTGGRGDVIYAKSQDPLPPPGFDAVSDSTVQIMPAANVSLSYKPVEWNTLFFTYSYSESPVSALGGGFALKNNKLATGDFHVESELYETGTKFSLLDDQLFLSLAFYRQTRGQNNVFSGRVDRVEVEGIELETTYQPNRNFLFNANVSLSDAQFKDTAVFQGTQSVNDVFDNSRPDIIQGGGLGSRAGGGFGFPRGNHELPGQPDFMFNNTVAYTFDNGFGASLGSVLTSPQNLDAVGKVVIPWQHRIDASTYFIHKRFEARVAFQNITNEKNWRPQFASFFGSETVLPELPFNVLATVKFKF